MPSFTPVLSSTGGGSRVYSEQIGRYQILDSLCHVYIRVAWTGGTSGNLYINNLPFIAKSAPANMWPVGHAQAINISWPAGAKQINSTIQSGTTNAMIMGFGPSYIAQLQDAPSGLITIDIMYEIQQ